MVPWDVQAEDIIFLFAGSKCPFVLRSWDKDKSKYQIVGGCYVHGMMNGEALNSGTWKDVDIHLQ